MVSNGGEDGVEKRQATAAAAVAPLTENGSGGDMEGGGAGMRMRRTVRWDAARRGVAGAHPPGAPIPKETGLNRDNRRSPTRGGRRGGPRHVTWRE